MQKSDEDGSAEGRGACSENGSVDGSGNVSLQEQLQRLQQAVQSASEAWCAPPPVSEPSTEAREAEAPDSISREEADSLVQRVDAAEQVRSRALLISY